MCGHSFDPNLHTACAACPVKRGCQLVCCPACGFETINPQGSVLARLVLNLINRKEMSNTRQAGEKSP